MADELKKEKALVFDVLNKIYIAATLFIRCKNVECEMNYDQNR